MHLITKMMAHREGLLFVGHVIMPSTNTKRMASLNAPVIVNLLWIRPSIHDVHDPTLITYINDRACLKLLFSPLT